MAWDLQGEGDAGVWRRVAACHSVPGFDLPARLASAAKPRAEYFEDNMHPTAEGHALIAREVADVIRARH